MDVMLLMLGSAVTAEGLGVRFSGFLGLGLLFSLCLAMIYGLTCGLLFYS